MGYVYFIKHKGMSPIKIGMTNNSNLSKRLDQHSTSSPYGIKLIGKIKTPNAKKLETKIHLQLSHCRLNGEWFDITQSKARSIIDRFTHDLIPIPLTKEVYKYTKKIIY